MNGTFKVIWIMIKGIAMVCWWGCFVLCQILVLKGLAENDNTLILVGGAGVFALTWGMGAVMLIWKIVYTKLGIS